MTDGAAYPETFNFGADVVDRIAREADGPALLWVSAEGAERRYTYSDIARLTARLASSLSAQGVTKGDRVIVMLPRIPEWQIAMVACLKLGAVPVPCIEMLTAKDIALRVKVAGAQAVIARGSTIDRFADIADMLRLRIAVGGAKDWLDFDQLLEDGDEAFVPLTVAAEDPVLLYFTSGSTGQPKGVVHAARGLYRWRMSAIHWLDLKPGDLMWCTADTGWSKAGTSILFGPWSTGACSFFYDGPFVPEERLKLIARYGVTVYCASGTELLRLLDLDVAQHDLSRLRRTVSAGEALSPVVVERWRAATGSVVAEAYGQTESLMTLLNTPGMDYKSGAMGRAAPGCELAIIDETGAILTNGTEGDLAILAPNPQIMLGYWQDQARTESCYLNAADGTRWFVTGDRAMQDADGYFFHCGRRDDIINSAGYRIGPAEVEDALLAHPAVAEVAAVGAPDAARGEIVAAFVVLNSGYFAGEDASRMLQDHAKSITAPYKYPRAIYFVDSLPKTITGKIQRNELRARLAKDS